MPNKRKICTESLNSNQSIYIPSLNSYYPPESVINSAYRKVLDFKENAEKILEKEKSETLNLNEFSRAILESRSFEISLQHNCIKLKCYITLEKDKDAKKKRNDSVSSQMTPPATPTAVSHSLQDNSMLDSMCSPTNFLSYQQQNNKFQQKNNTSSLHSTPVNNNGGGAKKVNVEVIMKSNPFRVEENEKTTRMELIRNNYGESNGMLRFTYYVRPECEAKKFRDTGADLFENGRQIIFTNDFFTIYQDTTTGEMHISLNEIVQTAEEQKRTEALGEKLFTLLKDRPRHRALLTNECKLNHSFMSTSNSCQSMNLTPPNSMDSMVKSLNDMQMQQQSTLNNQEDETFYTRELIHIYGQPIVPSFHKYFNYQLSNTHYGYRTLRRLLNCDILKKYVKITKEEIKSLDRVVEFVQLTDEKCLSAFQLNITSFYDPIRFENGIVKNWLDVWYVDRLKEKYALNESTSTQLSNSNNNQVSYNNSSGSTSSWSIMPQLNETNSCFLHTINCDHKDSECDQANHLWFCLQDYSCLKMDDFMHRIKDYIQLRNNRSELIMVHTLHPVFEYKDVLSETRKILAMFLNKSNCAKSLDEIIGNHMPQVAKEHIEILLTKFLNIDEGKQIVGFTALFEILMILKRELTKEKNDEMKYSHFLCTLERANQEKLKMAIVQLKCVPCLNKFTTNFNLINSNAQAGGLCTSNSNSSINNSNMLNQSINNKNMVSHANMSRLLKQMSLIVSTELQQIAIDLVERLDEDKLVKFIRLKDEFRHVNSNSMGGGMQSHQLINHQVQQQKYSSIANKLANSNIQSQNALLLKQQQLQINGQLANKHRNLAPQLSQMNFSRQQQVELPVKEFISENNPSHSHSVLPVNQALQKPNNQIFNPYKAISQYKNDEKLMSLNLPSLQQKLADRCHENLA
jgi:hypothetical protein